MKKFDIRLPAKFSADKIVNWFEKGVRGNSLIIRSRGTLKTIPDCVHWHIAKTGHQGTLEATFDTIRPRLWLCYHDNRHADWIDEAVVRIKKMLESD